MAAGTTADNSQLTNIATLWRSLWVQRYTIPALGTRGRTRVQAMEFGSPFVSWAWNCLRRMSTSYKSNGKDWLWSSSEICPIGSILPSYTTLKFEACIDSMVPVKRRCILRLSSSYARRNHTSSKTRSPQQTAMYSLAACNSIGPQASPKGC